MILKDRKQFDRPSVGNSCSLHVQQAKSCRVLPTLGRLEEGYSGPQGSLQSGCYPVQSFYRKRQKCGSYNGWDLDDKVHFSSSCWAFWPDIFVVKMKRNRELPFDHCRADSRSHNILKVMVMFFTIPRTRLLAYNAW